MIRPKVWRLRAVGAATGIALSAALLGAGSATAQLTPPMCGGMSAATAAINGYAVYDISGGGPAQNLTTAAGRKDWVLGSPFSDIITTLDGGDIICSMDGADFVYSGTKEDEVYLGNGNDYVEAGPGSDFVRGEDDDDEIYGDARIQELQSDGFDDLHGGEDADFLYGGGKIDTLHGGQNGNDDDDADGGSGADNCFEMEQPTLSC